MRNCEPLIHDLRPAENRRLANHQWSVARLQCPAFRNRDELAGG